MRSWPRGLVTGSSGSSGSHSTSFRSLGYVFCGFGSVSFGFLRTNTAFPPLCAQSITPLMFSHKHSQALFDSDDRVLSMLFGLLIQELANSSREVSKGLDLGK